MTYQIFIRAGREVACHGGSDSGAGSDAGAGRDWRGTNSASVVLCPARINSVLGMIGVERPTALIFIGSPTSPLCIGCNWPFIVHWL